MFFSTVIRRCLLPAAAVVAEAKINASREPEVSNCRPSELPIYTPEPTLSEEQELAKQQEGSSTIENSIRSVRQTLGKYSQELKAYERVAKESITESKQNIEWLIDYLRQEDNTLPKAGAIGIGALTGLIFGLRGGFFKKTIYATTGALGMAAVCYPKEASEYTQVGVVEGKKYLTIAYNFVYGDEAQQKMDEVKNTKTGVSSSDNKVKPAVLTPTSPSTPTSSQSVLEMTSSREDVCSLDGAPPDLSASDAPDSQS